MTREDWTVVILQGLVLVIVAYIVLVALLSLEPGL